MHALEHAPPTAAHDPQLRRFESLYRDEFAFVWSVAQHLGVQPAVLDDVVQDVFLTAYRRLDHLRFEVSPRAWLFGVTRRVAFRYRRGAARRARRLTAFAELGRPHGDAPQQRHDDAQQLERLLARLSDGTRAVWQMTELLGMSAPEISSELGLPLNTVYSRLRLARTQLQAMVADPTLAAWRDETRRRRDPPGHARQRTWAALVPAFNYGSTSVGILGVIKTHAAMATTLIATTITAATLVIVGPGPAPAARPAPAGAATPITTASTQPQIIAAPAVAPAVSVPVPERRTASTPAAIKTVQTQVGGVQAHLAEEIALIDRAHAQLAADDSAAALATIAAHAGRFPAGMLADVREAARVDAHCRRGAAADAEATARRLLATYPASAVAQRFDNYRCTR